MTPIEPAHDTPRGYGPLTQPGRWWDHLPQLLCLRCGAVVAEVRTHDLWHGGVDR